MSRLFLALAASLVLAGCDDSVGPSQEPPPSNEIASVTVTPSAANLAALDGTVPLTATARTADGRVVSGQSFQWSSSDDSVARVDAEGVVTAVGNGTASIVARAAGVSGSASIEVEQVAVQLEFAGQPTEAVVGEAMPVSVRVAAQDAGGSTVEDEIVTVELAIGANPGDGALSGPTSAVTSGGVAAFDQLSIDALGFGYTIEASALGLAGTTSAPFDVFVPFASIRAGAGFSCGLVTTGQAYCWGLNDAGQLGDGTAVDRQVPVAVSGGMTFASIDAGSGTSCGITMTGAAYCWGNNNSGQLGDGTTVDSPVPVAVSGGLSFADLSAYGSHTCGVTTDGAAYCWGWDGVGQLGDGSATADANPTPVPVSGGLLFAAVTVGSSHSCGVTTENAAYCWGSNLRFGQLGNGEVDVNSAAPVAVSGGHAFSAVRASLHSTCGVTTEGVAHCWGDNRGGQLGDGSRTARPTPAPVEGGLIFSVVHPGCGVTVDNTGYCWGGGISESNPPLEPLEVPGGLEFEDILAGGNHDCGITTLGAPFCWGSNNWGQLGDGTLEWKLTPVRVAGPR